ncbi:hypothetical protein IWX64_003375 [Arthrobacter sp. CAN_A212]|uniref:LPD29 domain-containing protein n=1 Tax=Arthrobacter sp. CAN_A212 TaxID=2787719 RepID=UPI0018CB7EE3
MRYISAKDTAALIRKDLKADFPGIKFSVRTNTYSGGASIDVAWTDGPALRSVEAITNHYQGKAPVDQTDHAATVTGELDGEQVHYLADHVFARRRISEDTKEALVAELAAALNVSPVETGKSYPSPELVYTACPNYRYDQGTAYEFINVIAEARAA